MSRIHKALQQAEKGLRKRTADVSLGETSYHHEPKAVKNHMVLITVMAAVCVTGLVVSATFWSFAREDQKRTEMMFSQLSQQNDRILVLQSSLRDARDKSEKDLKDFSTRMETVQIQLSEKDDEITDMAIDYDLMNLKMRELRNENVLLTKKLIDVEERIEDIKSNIERSKDPGLLSLAEIYKKDEGDQRAWVR